MIAGILLGLTVLGGCGQAPEAPADESSPNAAAAKPVDRAEADRDPIERLRALG